MTPALAFSVPVLLPVGTPVTCDETRALRMPLGSWLPQALTKAGNPSIMAKEKVKSEKGTCLVAGTGKPRIRVSHTAHTKFQTPSVTNHE